LVQAEVALAVIFYMLAVAQEVNTGSLQTSRLYPEQGIA
jgi:hypothetical protein